MSEPKPPFGFKTFIDYKMEIITTREWDRAARAELAQLRAKAAAYDEAMSALRLLRPECFCAIECRVGCDLCAFVGRELAANRFAP